MRQCEKRKQIFCFLQIESVDTLCALSRRYGEEFLPLKAYGWKPDFWVPTADAIITECLILDNAKNQVRKMLKHKIAYVLQTQKSPHIGLCSRPTASLLGRRLFRSHSRRFATATIWRFECSGCRRARKAFDAKNRLQRRRCSSRRRRQASSLTPNRRHRQQ